MKTLALATILALGLLAAPLVAETQQTGRVYRIGFLRSGPPPETFIAGFRQGLRELGYIEGQNITIEYGLADSTDRLPGVVAELVRRQVDLLLASGTPPVAAAKNATQTIPIVFVASIDPVASGAVASLARPGGNITGLAGIHADLMGKRLELLREAVPRLSRVALLSHAANPGNVQYIRQVQLLKEAIPRASTMTLLVDTSERSYRQAVSEAEVAAGAVGVKLRRQEVSHADELESAFASIVKAGSGPVIVVGGTLFSANRPRLVEGARKSRLPMMCYGRPNIEAGCLMSYSPDVTDLFRRAARYVDKILKGATPADLPVEQAEKFELVVNLKTAKALGLTIPQSLLLRADHVIE